MHLLVKAVTILYELFQFLSGIFNHVLMELHSMVHTKWPLEKQTNKTNTGTIFSLQHVPLITTSCSAETINCFTE